MSESALIPQRARMTNVDAAWLHMEHPANLMMISGVLFFDEPVDLNRLRDVIQARMVDPFPRFSMRVDAASRTFGATYWEADPHFDINAHIESLALPPPGDKASLEMLVSTIMSTPLDFDRPLWHFYIIENYRGGSAMLARMHHSIGDGIALSRVLLSLTDEHASGNSQTPPTLPGRTALAKRARRSGGSRLRRVANTAGFGLRGVAALGKLVLSWPDPRTVFKGPLIPQKRAAWSSLLPLEDARAISTATGATINDVLMSCMAGALRRYLISRDALVPQVRVTVPVNLRPLDGPIELGNKFGLVYVKMPVGLATPLERLAAVKADMDKIKRTPEPLVAYGLLGLIGIMPPAIERIAMSIFGAKVSAVLTNVPGPREPIYMAGARVRGLTFWVPQSGGVGMGISIFSYCGHVILGVATDTGLVDDPDAIVEAFHEEYVDLARHAGVAVTPPSIGDWL